MEGDLTFYVGRLCFEIDLFIRSSVHITVMLSQEGNEETGVDKAFKTRGSLKAQLSALCGSLTFLLLQMSRF